MTVSTEASALSFNGDDSTVAFAITWKYSAKADVVATLRDSSGSETIWVLSTDYSLTDAGVDSGGTLTATTAPATGETLVITLEPDNTQTASLPVGGPFPSQAVEDALDLAAQRDSKLEDFQDRTFRVPKTDTQAGSNLEFPIDSDRASKFLSFDANGKPIAAAGTSADLTPVSAYINTLLDDADAATARATLGTASLTAGNTITGVQDLTGATLSGASPLVLEGATADGNETTVAVTDPTADNTMTIPDESGTVSYGVTKNFHAGLTLSNDTDTDHDINVTAGGARDSTDSNTLILAAEQTKQIDASWATGDDAGGLSSSLTVANDTWYHVFLVLIGGTVEVLFDTSLTCANGVADHTVTKYRRIGSILTDGSANILGFSQYGSHFTLDATIADLATSSSGTTAATRTLSTPLGVKVDAKLRVYQDKAAATIYHLITDLSSDDEAPSATNSSLAGTSAAASVIGVSMNVITNTSSQIRTRASAASCTLNIETYGWNDLSFAEGL